MPYHKTQDEHGNDFEVFYMAAKDWPDQPDVEGKDGLPEPDMRGVEDGWWWWWFCSPGCMPEGDGEPNGPFATEQAAIDDCNAYCNS